MTTKTKKKKQNGETHQNDDDFDDIPQYPTKIPVDRDGRYSVLPARNCRMPNASEWSDTINYLWARIKKLEEDYGNLKEEHELLRKTKDAVDVSTSTPAQLQPKESFSSVVRKKNPRPRSNTVISKGTVSTTEIAATYSSLCPKDPPHMDFCVRGLPKEASEVVFRKYVEELGVKIRFIRIKKLTDDDLRGTTFARVGTFEEDAEIMMDGNKWLKHFSVRKWCYHPRRSNIPLKDVA